MRKRQFGKRIWSVVLAMLMAASMSTGALAAEEAIGTDAKAGGELDIAVISDVHVIPEDMWGDSEDAEKASAADRKMFAESEAILDATIKQLIDKEPDVVLIPGDLTKDGELESHQHLANKLAELKEAVPDVKIYVINGNHDINNPNAYDYSGDTRVEATRTTPEDFREVYQDFGYQGNEYFVPTSGEAGSNSYVAHPADGFTVIAVDAGKYSADATDSGLDRQQTGGNITGELLDWVTEKAGQARENGDEVIVFQHHGVIPHYAAQTTIAADYLVDNYAEAGAAYAKSGIHFVFTGHGHAQSIVSADFDGETLYDIETNSLVTYPSAFRYVTLGNSADGPAIDIKTDYVRDVEFNGQTISDFTAYAHEQLDLENMLPTLVGSMGGDLIQGLVGEGGTEALVTDLVSGLVGQEVTDLSATVISMLTTPGVISEAALIGSSPETAMRLEGMTFGSGFMAVNADIAVWHDSAKQRFQIDVKATMMTTSLPSELYINDADIGTYLVDALFTQLDGLLADGAYMSGLLARVLDSAGNYQVDDTHSFYDLAGYAYSKNIDGTAGDLDPWAADARDQLISGEALTGLMDGVRAQLLAELMGTNAQGDELGALQRIKINYGQAKRVVSGARPRVDGLITSVGDAYSDEEHRALNAAAAGTPEKALYNLINNSITVSDAAINALSGSTVSADSKASVGNLLGFVMGSLLEEGQTIFDVALGGETLGQTLDGVVGGLLINVLDSFMMAQGEHDNNNFSLNGGGNADTLKLNAKVDDIELADGDEFGVDAGFSLLQESNAAILTYKYDASKFEYVGFAAAEGVTVVPVENKEATAGEAVVTMMRSGDYNFKDLGKATFRVLDATGLKDQKIELNVEYVLRTEGEKAIKNLAGTAAFTESSGGEEPDPDDCDTNGDGTIDLIDLSNIIDWFGKTDEDSDWADYERFDFDDDGDITVRDIGNIAKLIA